MSWRSGYALGLSAALRPCGASAWPFPTQGELCKLSTQFRGSPLIFINCARLVSGLLFSRGCLAGHAARALRGPGTRGGGGGGGWQACASGCLSPSPRALGPSTPCTPWKALAAVGQFRLGCLGCRRNEAVTRVTRYRTVQQCAGCAGRGGQKLIDSVPLLVPPGRGQCVSASRCD